MRCPARTKGHRGHVPLIRISISGAEHQAHLKPLRLPSVPGWYYTASSTQSVSSSSTEQVDFCLQHMIEGQSPQASTKLYGRIYKEMCCMYWSSLVIRGGHQEHYDCHSQRYTGTLWLPSNSLLIRYQGYLPDGSHVCQRRTQTHTHAGLNVMHVRASVLLLVTNPYYEHKIYVIDLNTISRHRLQETII